jgi:hypothetical protein
VEGSLDELRVFISLLEAQRYQQLLDACEETGSSPSGNTVSCGFDYHLFGSDDVGLGPYTGSSFGFTVRDGEIVRASLSWGTDEFSPQMWKPFAALISGAYPRDAALMYGDETHTGVRLTEESVALWGQHIPEYVRKPVCSEGVDRRTAPTAVTPLAQRRQGLIEETPQWPRARADHPAGGRAAHHGPTAVAETTFFPLGWLISVAFSKWQRV